MATDLTMHEKNTRNLSKRISQLPDVLDSIEPLISRGIVSILVLFQFIWLIGKDLTHLW
jgi:hypothetical protein